ncbi:MAG: amidohydrolase family protein, partial [Candidatus Gallimonas sp.]
MKRFIDCAMKREKSELVIRGAQVFNVFTGGTEAADLAIDGGKIVAVGHGYEGREIIEANGLFALPAFADAHIHVESSLLSPEEFAALAVAHGTTAIVADPHEITNVCGVQGAEYMAEAFLRLKTPAGRSPLDVRLQLPSCVPATPFETSGATIDGRETERELARPLFHGLGEMMNFPAVLSGEEDCLRKLEAAKRYGKIADGHAPALSEEGLNAYLCAGILTDHEALTASECAEKVARGMYCQLRNGSSARNLEENAKAVTAYNFRRFLLCSDDKNAEDLKRNGHIDDALRRAVACGIPAAQAICMATSNVAECYGWKGKGALAPGYDADIVLVEDLTSFRVRTVIKGGETVARDGRALFGNSERYLPDCVRGTVRTKEISAESFRLPLKSGRARAIRIQPYGLVTEPEIV